MVAKREGDNERNSIQELVHALSVQPKKLLSFSVELSITNNLYICD